MRSEVKGDFRQLDILVKAVSSKEYVKVGIMGGHNVREATGKLRSARQGGGHRVQRGSEANLTNAELGAIHELGSATRGIPPRSFLRMPLQHQTTQILKEASVGMLSLLAQGKMTMILKRLGIACENAIQLAFATRGFNLWPPNSLTTVLRKRSNSPLIDTAQLRRSITSKVESAE